MINDDQIGVFSCARLDSQRCKNKMIRKFGDSSLTDIFLSKLNKIEANTFFSGYEKIFKEKCEHYDIRFVPRTRESSISEVAKVIYSFLNEVEYKYLLMVNACIPFLRIQTINHFLDNCKKNKTPAFAVFEKNNYFMSSENEPYNFSREIKTINTKFVKPVREFAHVFYFFEREYFLKHHRYWDWNEVDYITIPHGIECLDIDTEEDFNLAKLLWDNKTVRNDYQDW